MHDKMLRKEKGKAVSQSKRQEAVVRTAGKWKGEARRGSMHGKMLGKEKCQVARQGKERIKAW